MPCGARGGQDDGGQHCLDRVDEAPEAGRGADAAARSTCADPGKAHLVLRDGHRGAGPGSESRDVPAGPMTSEGPVTSEGPAPALGRFPRLSGLSLCRLFTFWKNGLVSVSL